MQTIRDLLSRDLAQPIEEVIKVDQQDEQTVHDEIREYVATDRIKRQYIDVLKPIADAPSEPTEGVGVWVSGFFGSGKSSFAKILGYILANRRVLGQPASELFLKQLWEQVQKTPALDDDRLVEAIENQLNFINARFKAHVIMFDVQVDRAVRRATEPIAEIMYTVLLRELDYAQDYDVAELEIELEGEGRLAVFVQACAQQFGDKVGQITPADMVPPTLSGVSADDYAVWQRVRKGAQRIQRASAVLHEIDPNTYPSADSWASSLQKESDITIRTLVERTFMLTERRKPGHTVIFVIDEVGQYVARSADKIENLRAVVEHFGQESKNRVLANKAVAPVWVIVTSQEKLDEVVAAIDDKRVELAKMQDRFPFRVDMAPADIREVATRRVLAKTAAAEALLAQRFKNAAAQLKTHTRLERTSRTIELDEQTFVQHYPYLPHFIDLSIDIVSGVRLTAGGPRHIGGSNRTIIKQAYEMLVSDRTNLADAPVGALVTLDRIYDLIEGNLPSEKQKDITDIGARWPDDPWPARTAKAIALLEYVRDLPRSEANLAALLYRELGATSPLVEVERSVKLLEEHQFVRQTENGWKLQTAQEKSWTAERNAFNPNPRERNELLEERLRDIFSAANLTRYRHKLGRNFRVGASWENRRLTSGDSQIPLVLSISEGPEDYQGKCDHVRGETRNEGAQPWYEVYWVTSLTTEIDEIVAELYRSRQMVGKYNQLRAQGKINQEESASLSNEKTAVLRLEERLKDRLDKALANGLGYFRGVEKAGAALGKSLAEILRALFDHAVPALYPKLEMGTRPMKGNEAEEILKAANLNGLSKIFYGPPDGLDLVAEEGNKYVVNNQAPIIKEVADYLNREHAYGNKVTGKVLEGQFGGLGYGWEPDMIRLVLATLLRGGGLEVTYQGRRYRNHLDPQVRIPFVGVQAFRSASFAPRKAIDLQTLVSAARRYEMLTGDEVDVEETAIAQAFQALARYELEALLPVEATVKAHNIPVTDVLQEYRTTLETVLNSLSDDAVGMLAGEGTSFQQLREEVARIRKATDDEGLERLRRMRRAANQTWPLLRQEAVDGQLEEQAEYLEKLLAEGQIHHLPPDARSALKAIEQTYRDLYAERHEARRRAFAQAVDEVKAQPDWPLVPDELQDHILNPLVTKAEHDLDLAAGAMTCALCQAGLAQIAADITALDGIRSQILLRIQKIIAPEEKVERVRLADVVGVGHTLSTHEEIDAVVEELKAHLYKLIDAETKVILE
jgi:phage terminase Nu1 subunit (DNA packaging protein)